jgi:hypothetical protein
MTTTTTSPRILIVADFGPGSGGGSWVLLKQFLRGLDWNRVYWWSLFDAALQPRIWRAASELSRAPAIEAQQKPERNERMDF